MQQVKETILEKIEAELDLLTLSDQLALMEVLARRIRQHAQIDETPHSSTPGARIIRTERGLTVDGTRLTIYMLMDSLKDGQPHSEIQALFRLSDAQMQAVLDYIDAHHDEVEAEYQLVVKQAEENRAYWEDRNRERLKDIAAKPPRPGYEEVYAKIRQRKQELGME